MDQPRAPPKSVLFLIVATVVLELSPFLPALLLYMWIEHVPSRPVPLEGLDLLIELTKLSAYAIALFGDYILGGVIGQGNVRSGLADQPISRRATVGMLAALIAA
jgi:hypothetical protein